MFQLDGQATVPNTYTEIYVYLAQKFLNETFW